MSSKAVSLRSNLADTMCISIGNLQSFTTKCGNVLTIAVGSTYGEFSQRVIAAIEARLHKAISASVNDTSLRRQGADATFMHIYPQNYLTQKEIDIMRNAQITPYIKMTTLLHRLVVLLGCTNPHEQTFRWWVALFIVMAYTTTPSCDDIHSWVLTFKQTAEAMKTKPPFEQLNHFSESPHDLPQHVRNYAYDPDGPVALSLDQLASVANKVPLRGNNKLLSDAYTRLLKTQQPHGIVKSEPKCNRNTYKG